MFKEKLYLDALRLYAGQHVVDRIEKQGRQALKYTYEPQVITMLFIDFLSVDSEGFSGFDPAKLRTWLHDHHELVAACVDEHDGVIDSFMGDAVFACWGLTPRVDHAALALRCAEKLYTKIAAVSTQDQARGLPGKRLMIGVNTGMVALGNHGTVERARFTVMGDAVNLANRLVNRCQEYGVSTLTTEATVVMAGGAVPTREVDTIHIKGRRDPLRIYTLDAGFVLHDHSPPPVGE